MTRSVAIKRIERYYNSIKNCEYLPEIIEAIEIALNDMREAEKAEKQAEKQKREESNSSALLRLFGDEYV